MSRPKIKPGLPKPTQKNLFVVAASRDLTTYDTRRTSTLVKVVMSSGHAMKVSRVHGGRGQLKYDGTRAETRFRLSAKRKSPSQSAVASVQSTTGSRGVRISFYCW